MKEVYHLSNKATERVFVNHNIKVPKVLLITHENVNLGVIPTSQALQIAQESNLDLVQVTPPTKDRPPTCKLMDYGKHKYNLSKKKKEADRKQRESTVKEKEIWFRPSTGLNDLRVKAEKALQFLEEGCRLKVKIKFTGREISHKNVAMQTLYTFVDLVPSAQMESNPSMDDGRVLSVFLVKKVVEKESK